MGEISNGLDGGVGQQGGTIITKSGESGGVVGAPTAPTNVQIANKARRVPKVRSLKRQKNMFARWNQGTPRLNFSNVHQKPRGIRASFSAPP